MATITAELCEEDILSLQDRFAALDKLSRENEKGAGVNRTAPDHSLLHRPARDDTSKSRNQILSNIGSVYAQIFRDVTAGTFHTKEYAIDNTSSYGIPSSRIIAIYYEYFPENGFYWVKHAPPNMRFTMKHI